MAAPTKDEREKCWNARDSLWKCLDENNDDESKCTKFRKAFQKHCSKQWVCKNLHCAHFDSKKNMVTSILIILLDIYL